MVNFETSLMILFSIPKQLLGGRIQYNFSHKYMYYRDNQYLTITKCAIKKWNTVFLAQTKHFKDLFGFG